MIAATKNDAVLSGLFNLYTFLEECARCRILRVSDYFRQYILRKQRQILFRGLEGVASRVLTRGMTIQEIAEEFFGGMKEMQRCALTFDHVAEKIYLHQKKKDIEMRHGNASVFYVSMGGEFFVVRVYWDIGARKLFMHGWPANEHTETIRDAGTVFFFKNNIRKLFPVA